MNTPPTAASPDRLPRSDALVRPLPIDTVSGLPRAHRAHVVGGKEAYVHNRLASWLAHHGIVVASHLDFDRSRKGGIPEGTEVVVLFKDMAGHAHEDSLRPIAVARGIPWVRIDRKQAIAQRQLTTAGYPPITDPSLRRALLPRVDGMTTGAPFAGHIAVLGSLPARLAADEMVSAEDGPGQQRLSSTERARIGQTVAAAAVNEMEEGLSRLAPSASPPPPPPAAERTERRDPVPLPVREQRMERLLLTHPRASVEEAVDELIAWSAGAFPDLFCPPTRSLVPDARRRVGLVEDASGQLRVDPARWAAARIRHGLDPHLPEGIPLVALPSPRPSAPVAYSPGAKPGRPPRVPVTVRDQWLLEALAADPAATLVDCTRALENRRDTEQPGAGVSANSDNLAKARKTLGIRATPRSLGAGHKGHAGLDVVVDAQTFDRACKTHGIRVALAAHIPRKKDAPAPEPPTPEPAPVVASPTPAGLPSLDEARGKGRWSTWINPALLQAQAERRLAADPTLPGPVVGAQVGAWAAEHYPSLRRPTNSSAVGRAHTALGIVTGPDRRNGIPSLRIDPVQYRAACARLGVEPVASLPTRVRAGAAPPRPVAPVPRPRSASAPAPAPAPVPAAAPVVAAPPSPAPARPGWWTPGLEAAVLALRAELAKHGATLTGLGIERQVVEAGTVKL